MSEMRWNLTEGGVLQVTPGCIPVDSLVNIVESQLGEPMDDQPWEAWVWSLDSSNPGVI